MPQTMLTVRGNLGANPDYLPEKTMEDGAILPSKLQAVVYENRRVRTADGGWTDDPRGPVKTTVQLFGNAADTVRRIDMRQGDPSSPAAASPSPPPTPAPRTASPTRATSSTRNGSSTIPSSTSAARNAPPKRSNGRILPVRDPARDRGGASMMKFLDDEGREGTGVGRKAVLRAHAPVLHVRGGMLMRGEVRHMGGIRAPRRRARLHASRDKGGGHRERAGRPPGRPLRTGRLGRPPRTQRRRPWTVRLRMRLEVLGSGHRRMEAAHGRRDPGRARRSAGEGIAVDVDPKLQTNR